MVFDIFPVLIRICFKVPNTLPLRLGASSLRVDYDQASRCLQPIFDSKREFSSNLSHCSFVSHCLTQQCGGIDTSLSLSFVSDRLTSAIWGDGEAEEGRTAPTTVR